MAVKHTIRDIFIFLISVTGIAFLYRKQYRKKGPLVRVISFHHIYSEKWFKKIIEMLYDKFHVISPEEFHTCKFDLEKINILITFDDGFHSWIETALPILEKYGLKAVFFVSSELLDVAADTETSAAYMRERLIISPKKPLTWGGARKLRDSGHTIGSHSYSHKNLATLSAEDLKYEIEKDKGRIEAELGLASIDFAYPFGTKNDYNKQVAREVKKTGYTHQYSAEPGFININNSKIPIKRLLIEKDQSTESFARWIEGSYDIFAACKIL